MAEQLPTSYYATPYKFNGKELDESTGLYYYGARYYDPVVSGWLSVDPMMEHAPDKSPYHYCSHNPVNRTDPTGMCDDPNCSHGGMRQAWDAVGRFFGLWGYRSKSIDVGPISGAKFMNGFLNSANEFRNEAGTIGALANVVDSSLDQIEDIASGNANGYDFLGPTGSMLEGFVDRTISAFSGDQNAMGSLAFDVTLIGAGKMSQPGRIKVYRVFGGDAKASGWSWTTENPDKVSNFRDAAGLPSGGESGSYNTGRFIIEGSVKKNRIWCTKCITIRW